MRDRFHVAHLSGLGELKAAPFLQQPFGRLRLRSLRLFDGPKFDCLCVAGKQRLSCRLGEPCDAVDDVRDLLVSEVVDGLVVGLELHVIVVLVF